MLPLVPVSVTVEEPIASEDEAVNETPSPWVELIVVGKKGLTLIPDDNADNESVTFPLNPFSDVRLI